MSPSSTLTPGQRLQVTIERLVFQGDGLGRLPDGRVIFVPYTAPGDVAEVEIAEARSDFVRGRLGRLLTPAADRAAPPCRYYERCGGCQWQHLSHASQLYWKREILQELLARVGKLEGISVADPVTPAAPWEYRARAQFKVSGGNRPSIGFHQRETNRVVDIERCPLLDHRLNSILAALRAMKHPPLARLFPGLREIWMALGSGTGEAVVSLFAGVRERAAIRLLFHTIQAALPTLQGVVLLQGDPRQHPRFVDRHGHGAIMEQVGDHRFRIDATAFFQVSGAAAALLTALVMELAALRGSERVLDLYCGVGTFTVPLSRRAREVVGIEASAAAAVDCVHNLRSNGCGGARTLHAQVEQVRPTILTEGPWDLVVLDPPRQGVSRLVLDAIASTAVPRLIYVSCDPSTLARDLGILSRAGFRCVSLHPVDLFPQTFHLEAVALLERMPAPATSGLSVNRNP
ncbi:MAG TPA: 23S rRNA (uracil(1939)-C(5))-methyltransferase RlmD [Candidatus Acidoferrum sp.]|nr:23S rRNA (uracil(1939)-C(5))-methyltransferase RlmD [Candidatus Acidoferrum sp.]